MTLAELERRARAAGVDGFTAARRPGDGAPAWRIMAYRDEGPVCTGHGTTLDLAAEDLLAKLEHPGAGKRSYSPPVDPEGYPK